MAEPEQYATQKGPPLIAGGDSILREVQRALDGLRYGMVSITVQDGVVVQIERTERHRPQQAAQRR